MKVAPVDLSRFRAWAVNSPEFLALSLRARDRVRKALATQPDQWTAEAVRYIEAGRRAFQ